LKAHESEEPIMQAVTAIGLDIAKSVRFACLRKQLADPAQNHPVNGSKWHPTGPAPSQYDDLLTQHEVLGLHGRARPEQVDDNSNNQSAEIHHPAEDRPILRFTPTGWNLRQGHH
jgi:hypothetical protein